MKLLVSVWGIQDRRDVSESFCLKLWQSSSSGHSTLANVTSVPGFQKLLAMEVSIKFMRLLMFGAVTLIAKGASAQNSVKSFPLDEATISDVHAAYESGALTSVRLVQA